MTLLNLPCLLYPILGIVMVPTLTASPTFTPFSDAPFTPVSKVPFAHPNPGFLDAISRVYEKQLPHHFTGRASETGYKSILQFVCLLSPYRNKGATKPSFVWQEWIGPICSNLGLSDIISLYYDDLFLAIANASPNQNWYFPPLRCKKCHVLTLDKEPTKPHKNEHAYLSDNL